MKNLLKVALLFFCLSGHVTVLAGVEDPIVNYLDGTVLLQGTVPQVATQIPNFSVGSNTWDNGFKLKQVENLVALYIDSSVHLLTNFDFRLSVPITIYKDDNHATTTSIYNRVLIITYDPLAGTQYKQLDAWHGYGGCSVNVEVDQPNISITRKDGSPLTAANALSIIKQVVKLKNEIRVERYYELGTYFGQLASQLWHYPAISANGHELEINWNNVPGAEEYDVEWIYVDDYDASGTGYISAADIHFIFENNTSRVRVKHKNTFPNQKYNIPIVYEHGWLAYRMRAVGMSQDDLEERVYTPWSVPCMFCGSAANAANALNAYHITTAHENDNMNWQVVSTFAEDGKRQDQVSYFDGTMRSRQTVSVVYTDQPGQSYSVVGKTIYDWQGRPAVQVPPTPTSFSTLANLGFHENLNRSTATGLPYSWKDIDIPQDPLTPCLVSPATMSPAAGASRYYSSGNAFPGNTVKYRNHIPDAFGYPFTQVEYMPDNTGRIRRQSGIGEKHHLESGHETEYFYGVPAQEELDRIFGNEVGFAQRYDQRMSRDPNGQHSVEYLDAKGNVIATALAGIPLVNMEALPSYQVQTLTINLLDFNNKDYFDKSLTSEYTLLLKTEGTVVFNYEVTAATYQDLTCMAANICYDCIYDLDIQVVDHLNCDNTLYSYHQTLTLGELFVLDGSGNPVLDADGNPVLSVDCATPAAALSQSFSLPLTTGNLPVGSYKIIKKLKVNEAAADAYVQHFLTDPTNTCSNVYQTMLSAELALIDFSDCEIDCDALTADYQNSSITSNMTPQELPELQKDVEEFCSPGITRCQAAYQAMLLDVSPGGQYGKIPAMNPTAADWELSVYNPVNRLNPGVSSYMTLPVIVNGALATTLNLSGNLDDFLAVWQPDWAQSFVSLHPEYCYYEHCNTYLSDQFDAGGNLILGSDTYDAALIATEAYADAETKGYISSNPNAIAIQDPFFAGGPGAPDASFMNQRIGDYDESGAQTISMEGLAVAMVVCPATQTNPMAPFSCNIMTWTDLTDYANINNKPDLLDDAWTTYRGLYLSAKEKYLYKIRTQYAIDNGCYNGCIDDANLGHLEPAFFDFSDSEPPFDNTVTPFINEGNPYMGDPSQPCYWTTAHLYQDKVQRFPSAYTGFPLVADFYADPPTAAANELTQYVEGQVEGLCGDCGWSEQMSDFLYYYYSNYFPGTSPSTITLASPFNQDVLAAFLGTNTTTDVVSESYSNNFGDYVTITTGVNDVNSTECKMVIQSLPGVTITDFCCLEPLYNSTFFPNMPFHCQLTVTDAANITYPLQMGYLGNCPNICCHKEECPPTQEAQDLLALFSTLVLQNQFTVSHHVNPALIGNSIKSPNSLFTSYYWSVVTANSFYLDIGTGPLPCTFNFTLPSGFDFSQATQILGIEADETQGDALNHTKAFILKVKTLTGQIVEVPGTNTCFWISYCCTPYPDNGSPKPVSDEEIFKNCTGCLPITMTGGLLDGITTDCDDYPCGTPPNAITGTIDDGSPCKNHLIDVATHNAQVQYEHYLAELAQTVKAKYIKHCLDAATEAFSAVCPDATHHFTLYYYDQANNLVKTVPPLGVKVLTSAADLQAVRDYREGLSTTPVYPAHTLPSVYGFNSLNQLSRQTIPDHRDPNNANLPGTSQFFYDEIGRLVASQNPQQASVGLVYSYTIYDLLGRIIEVGEIEQPTNSLTDAIARNTNTSHDWSDWIATGSKRQTTNTYYDDPVNPVVSAYFGADGQENLRGRVASTTYTEQQSLTYETATHYSYDIHGNVKTLVQDIGGLGQKKVEYTYDLVGGNVLQLWYQRGQADQFSHQYSYDRNNRLRAVFTSPDGLIWDKDATYIYYPHGPLARIEMGSDDVQGLDYVYTIQGWLKSMNSVQQAYGIFDPGGDGLSWGNNRWVAQDAVGFTLGYFKDDYKSIAYTLSPGIGYAGSDFDADAPGLYNGNIRQMVTAIQPFMDNNARPVGYAYNYDQLNRLMRARAYDKVDQYQTIFANWASNASTPNYAQAFRYDANGNILRQTRHKKGNGITRKMDRLTYQYTNGNNQLTRVRDNVPASAYNGDLDDQNNAQNYQYDKTGNLTVDISEKLRYEWNVQNKVRHIYRKSTLNLDFRYDALGNRVMKKHYPSHTTTWHVGDAKGEPLAIYRETPDSLTFESALLYGSSRLGEYRPERCLSGNCAPSALTPDKVWRIRGQRHYELGNHLGNVLATISDRKIPKTYGSGSLDYYQADVLTATDYYAFGMGMPGRTESAGAGRYGFNGKENDNEVKGVGNYQDYGMRAYDGRLGRFFAVDPISKDYPELTPYQFASNNPIQNIDIDGLEGLAGNLCSPGNHIPGDANDDGTLSGEEAEEGLYFWGKILKVLAIGVTMVFEPGVGVPWAVSDITGLPAIPSPQAWSSSLKTINIYGQGEVKGVLDYSTEVKYAAYEVGESGKMITRPLTTSLKSGSIENIIINGSPLNETTFTEIFRISKPGTTVTYSGPIDSKYFKDFDKGLEGKANLHSTTYYNVKGAEVGFKSVTYTIK